MQWIYIFTMNVAWVYNEYMNAVEVQFYSESLWGMEFSKSIYLLWMNSESGMGTFLIRWHFEGRVHIYFDCTLGAE